MQRGRRRQVTRGCGAVSATLAGRQGAAGTHYADFFYQGVTLTRCNSINFNLHRQLTQPRLLVPCPRLPPAAARTCPERAAPCREGKNGPRGGLWAFCGMEPPGLAAAHAAPPAWALLLPPGPGTHQSSSAGVPVAPGSSWEHCAGAEGCCWPQKGSWGARGAVGWQCSPKCSPPWCRKRGPPLPGCNQS